MVESLNTTGAVQGTAIVRKVSAKVTPETAPQTTRADVPNLVRQAAEIANQGPPVDYVKLAQIRTAIFRGDYPLDARAIANAIAMQAHTS